MIPEREQKSGVCIHGALRRQCETCDLAERLDAAEAKCKALEAEAWEKADGVHEMRKLLNAAGLLDGTDKRIWQDLALACAERVLPIFEKRRPGDDRPRKAIEAARGYLDGSVTKEQLLLARRNAADAYADAADAAAARKQSRKASADFLRKRMGNPFAGGRGMMSLEFESLSDALNPSHLGNYAREIREGAGVGVREAARKVGCSPSYITRLELGEKSWNGFSALRYAKQIDRWAAPPSKED